MSQCGNAHREVEKDCDSPKISCGLRGVLTTSENLAALRVRSGIIVCPGRTLLAEAVALPLHQHTHACLQQLWKIKVSYLEFSHLANPPPLKKHTLEGFMKP